MIEFVSFGEGFRKDGADWGLRARPHLDRGWRRLAPGIHPLDNAATRNLVSNRLTVLSDGRARLTIAVDPAMRHIAEQIQVPMYAGSALFRSAFPIDEEQRVVPIINLAIADLEAAARSYPPPPPTLETFMNMLRLTGVLRYNP